MADEPAKPRSVSAAIASLLSLGKDLVALLRDGSLFLLAVLLLAFPTQFNAMLVAAGFKEGSVAGFKWQASLGETDRALEKAQETISQLQRKNDELAKTLGEASQRIVGGDGQLKAQIVELQQGNRTLSESVQSVQTRVDERLLSNQQLVASADRLKAAPADDIAAAPAATPVERYVVGLQTVGFDDAARLRVNAALQARRLPAQSAVGVLRQSSRLVRDTFHGLLLRHAGAAGGQGAGRVAAGRNRHALRGAARRRARCRGGPA